MPADTYPCDGVRGSGGRARGDDTDVVFAAGRRDLCRGRRVAGRCRVGASLFHGGDGSLRPRSRRP